jgi:hypothetical protein
VYLMKTLTTAQKFYIALIADLEARGHHKAAEYYRNSEPMLALAKAERKARKA